jgi:hypothetical protein
VKRKLGSVLFKALEIMVEVGGIVLMLAPLFRRRKK